MSERPNHLQRCEDKMVEAIKKAAEARMRAQPRLARWGASGAVAAELFRCLDSFENAAAEGAARAYLIHHGFAVVGQPVIEDGKEERP